MLFGKAPVIVLRESADILASVREALTTAGPHEQAGLQRAVDIIEAQCARTEDEVVSQWVRRVLSDAGVGADGNHTAAVAALRQAVPDLALTTANRLVTEARNR
ncbi:hypothetical protein ACFUJR_22245 [Streptomyces sp. NPDC057271]|uniref:hypothetical protein n=1 Tax=unclassified Streptomyces TaxID=2593676 RepID=UPI003644CBEF